MKSAAGGIALIIRSAILAALGEITLGLVVLAACSIMAGVVTFLMGHDSKMEMAGTRMMAG